MNRLNELLGTRLPIIQDGMANTATGEFAAVCSNAGALGVIAAGGVRTAQVVAQERVPVVTTGAGNPGKYIPAWKDAGIRVIPVVAAAVLARRLTRYGVDAIIAEGIESGGHVGEMTTMALVPQVIDAVDVPVIAAGGIADGRQLAAALALGACGAQVGTCLLASAECPVHEHYKQALLRAKGSDTIVTGRSVGGPVRVLKNRMSRKYVRMEQQGATLEELERLTMGGLRRAVIDGDVETGSVMAGQVAGMLHGIRPVRDILDTMLRDAMDVLVHAAQLVRRGGVMKLGFLYAGQGSQHAGMGRDLYETYPAFCEAFDSAKPGFDMKRVCFGDPDGLLGQTRYTQPCMVAFAVGLTAVLRERGMVPDAAAGLSLGEYSALHAAGVFDAKTAIELAAFRGDAIERAAQGKKAR